MKSKQMQLAERPESTRRLPACSPTVSRRPVLTALLGCLLVGLCWQQFSLRPGVLTWSSTSATADAMNAELLAEDWRHLPVGTLRWFACPHPISPTEPPGECGFLIVPTDYSDPSQGVTKIALGRKNATVEPRLGTVIFGAGGPGGPGALVVRLSGQGMQQAVTGEQWDIVGIDPRGIGDTEPATQCFPPGANNQLKANTVLIRNFDYTASHSVSETDLRTGLIRQQEEMDALVRTQYAMCGVKMGKKVRYMGTTTVVRDIERVVSAIEGEGALINYYGGSYGSIIGQYLVNMFPDRVGRVMVEGIVDVVAWANQPMYKSYRQWLSSTEDAYTWFTTRCAEAGPEACALYRPGDEEDPSRIRDRLEALFNQLYEKPLVVADHVFWGVVTSGMARTLLFRALQLPIIWPTVAVALSRAIDGDGTMILPIDAVFSGYKDLERQAVSCNDAPKPPLYSPPSNAELVDEILNVANAVSPFAFSILTAEPDAQCQYWPVEAPERFTGPWNQTLKNPILIQSNTADPVTPIASAIQLRDLLGNSAALLLQNGPGHGTTSIPTLCTINKTRAYFTDGTLPESGTVCELEAPLFPKNGQRWGEEYGEVEKSWVRAAEKMNAMMRGLDLSRLTDFL